MLSERLQALTVVGAVARVDGEHGPEYALTDAGKELMSLVSALAIWGQKWLPREAVAEDLDLEPLLVDMQRRVRFEALPREPIVTRFEIHGSRPRFLLLKTAEVSVCTHNPGFPEPLRVRSPLSALVAWWRGDASFAEARRMGLALYGSRTLARAFPGWFDRYKFAHIGPAVAAERGRHHAAVTADGIADATPSRALSA